jgi:TorA maturation chaperone TorD
MTTVLYRLWVYDYLARLFDGSLDHLPAPPGAAATSPRVSAAVDVLLTAVAGSPADDVRADHARLFVNAPRGVAAPPYASWYLDGQLSGASAQWVEQAYAARGLERAPDAGEPPDYLGAELEFLHFLARHELAARGTDDAASLRVILTAEKDFVLGHVARWLPPFIAQIRSSEPGPVFAAAADVLWTVLQDDVSVLSTYGSKSMASR